MTSRQYTAEAKLTREAGGTALTPTHVQLVSTQNEDAQSVFASVADHARLGYSLIPIGRDKSPAFAFKGTECSRQQVIAIMRRKGSQAFAVRTDEIVVVDIDTLNDLTLEYAQKRFGTPSYRVSTGRGEHWYYRDIGNGIGSRRIKKPGIAIDIKSGANSYVLAAGSVRDDSKRYHALSTLMPPDELSPFTDAEAQSDKPSIARTDGKVVEGRRNDVFIKWLIKGIGSYPTKDEAYQDAISYRHYQFENPETYSDAEVQRQVNWAWELRLQNRLWSEGKHHEIMDFFIGKGLANEWMLYSFLLRCGGFDKSKLLDVTPGKLARNKSIGNWSANRIQSAKQKLIEHRLLVKIRDAQKKLDAENHWVTEPALFQLQTVLPSHLIE